MLTLFVDHIHSIFTQHCLEIFWFLKSSDGLLLFLNSSNVLKFFDLKTNRDVKSFEITEQLFSLLCVRNSAIKIKILF